MIGEDGIDDAVAALGVFKTTHHLQPPSDFPEATLDNVGSADHPTDFFGKLKDRYQRVKIHLLLSSSDLDHYTAA